MNVLFVCSRNQWRSPTAEQLFKAADGLNVRSAGTASSARHTLSARDLEWADVVICMEQKHASQIRTNFGRNLPVEVLGIPDDFEYMDDELVDWLEEVVPIVLERHIRSSG